AVSPSLLLASYARKVGRRLAWKPWLPVSLLLRVAGVLLVAAAFYADLALYADYLFVGARWPVGQFAAFAAFGIACQLLGWNRLVLLMAMVLGPLLEENIRRALLISRGDPATFLRWPISGTVLLLAAAILTLAIVLSAWRALPPPPPPQPQIGKLNLATLPLDGELGGPDVAYEPMFVTRPLRPRKRTCRARLVMSQKRQIRTFGSFKNVWEAVGARFGRILPQGKRGKKQ